MTCRGDPGFTETAGSRVRVPARRSTLTTRTTPHVSPAVASGGISCLATGHVGAAAPRSTASAPHPVAARGRGGPPTARAPDRPRPARSAGARSRAPAGHPRGAPRDARRPHRGTRRGPHRGRGRDGRRGYGAEYAAPRGHGETPPPVLSPASRPPASRHPSRRRPSRRRPGPRRLGVPAVRRPAPRCRAVRRRPARLRTRLDRSSARPDGSSPFRSRRAVACA